MEEISCRDCSIKRAWRQLGSAAEAAESPFSISDESANHADSVFDLRIITIVRSARKRHARPQVEFVSQKQESLPESTLEIPLPGAYLLYQRARVFVSHRREKVVIVVKPGEDNRD